MTILTAISVGLALASSCFPLLATTVGKLGAWSLAAIAGCGALAWLVSRAYAELAGAWPTAAGVRVYAGQAFGARTGLSLALLYLFLVVALGASETWILSSVLARVASSAWCELALGSLTPAPASAVPPLAVGLGFIVVCALANVLGLEPAGRFQAVLTFVMVAGLLSLSFLFTGGGESTVTRASMGGLDALAVGLPGAMFLFVGFEWVVSAVEEVDESGRSLPRAMSFSLLTLTAVYAALAFALLVAVAPADLTTGITQHLTLGASRGGRVGLLAMAAISAVATITSFNGGILGASRLVYALAREGVLPRPLARLHGRFLTPWVAVLAVSALTALSSITLATTQAVRVPILIGAAIECLVYAVVLLALRRLRETQPDRARPYRAPFGGRASLALALVFFGLALGCVFAAGEWALPTAAWLAAAIVAASAYSAFALRKRTSARRAPARIVRPLVASAPPTPTLPPKAGGGSLAGATHG
ncbi:APC family permease [bacterium]|nr:APC family permease [bacterium]